MRITFGNATVKRLESERAVAERLNHLRLFKITECLLRLHRGDALGAIAEGLHISLRTVYNWLDLFIRRRFAWLCGHHYEGRGRKPKLNDQQKEQLYSIIAKSPLDYGFECGVWLSSMIVIVIEREFHVTYNVWPKYPNVLIYRRLRIRLKHIALAILTGMREALIGS